MKQLWKGFRSSVGSGCSLLKTYLTSRRWKAKRVESVMKRNFTSRHLERALKETPLDRRCKNLAMLIFSLSVSVGLYAAAAPTSSLYVSAHGSDSNPGTKEKPFLTVQHSADVAKPGDTINIRGGKYCERLAVPSS